MLDMIMQLCAKCTGSTQVWVPWQTAILTPISSGLLQAMKPPAELH